MEEGIREERRSDGTLSPSSMKQTSVKKSIVFSSQGQRVHFYDREGSSLSARESAFIKFLSCEKAVKMLAACRVYLRTVISAPRLSCS